MSLPNRRTTRYGMLASLFLLLSILTPTSPAAADAFTNTTPITIPASAGACGTSVKAIPYPSTISVSGLAQLADVEVTLTLTHSAPDDVGVLLVGPQGDEVLLMADTGGATAADAVTLTFDDAAGALPDAGPLVAGTFRPTLGTAGTGCTAPASFPTTAPAGPYPTSFAGFRLSDPNGTWRLFVIDDTAAGSGSISSWSLELTQAEPYLKVAVVGTGSGSVTAQGIACPPDCAEHADAGTPFRLHATPAAGSVFAGWTGFCTGTSPDCSIVLNLTGIVGARFEPAPSPTPPPPTGADLSVSASAPTQPLEVGSAGALTFTVANAGPEAVSGASLAIDLPHSLQVAAVPAGCTPAGSDLTCSLPSLPSGGQSSVIVSVAPTKNDDFVVTASVSSGTSDPDPADNLASLPLDVIAPCTIEGTNGPERLKGTNGIDVICGRGGADELLGLDGSDILRGGPGNDELHASLGNDTVLGDGGADRIFGGQGNDVCDATAVDQASGCERTT